jgi:PAS domain-containing protein
MLVEAAKLGPNTRRSRQNMPKRAPIRNRSSPSERRAPLRFVWTMDAGLRFQLAAPAFADAMGPRTAALIGEPWSEIAAVLGIDRDGRVANAVASRDTFSGIVIAWPAEASGETVPVELSGLPIFDRERTFTGYRGFGLCRDVARAAVARPQQAERPLLTIVPASKNVVPFRGSDSRQAPDPHAGRTLGLQRNRRHAGARRGAAGRARADCARASSTRSRRSRRSLKPQDPAPMPSAFATGVAARRRSERREATQFAILERLPVGILIHRADALLYANRAFLEWTGYADLDAVAAAGGLERLVADPAAGSLDPHQRHRQDLHDRNAQRRHAHLRRAGCTACRGRPRAR